MADDGSKQASAAWPLPKFHFEVRFGDADPISFQEVSGLDVENEPIEYRAGGSKQFSPVKMPGLSKHGNVTLEKGVFAKDNAFWDWFNDIKMNAVRRETVTISLLDESGAPTMVWKLSNAYPVKVSGFDLRAEGNEVAIETLELAHEEISIVRN